MKQDKSDIVFDKLRNVVAKDLKINPSIITSKTTFTELGASNIDRARLTMRFEEAFNKEIPDSAGPKLKSIGDVHKFFKQSKSEALFNKLAGEGWDVAGYGKSHKDLLKLEAKNPETALDIRMSNRIKTPHTTNWKLNSLISNDQVSDFVYGTKPIDKPMSKSQYRKVLKTYKNSAKNFKVEPGEKKYIDAFIGKSEALLKNPKTKFIRLETE